MTKDEIRERLVELMCGAREKCFCTRCIKCKHYDGAPYPDKGCQDKLFADYLVAHGVTIQRWIPVSERLPDICDKDPNWSQTVVFRTSEGHIHSGYRNIGRQPISFYDDDWTPPYWLDESEDLSFEEDEVTHWMPMPEPPKEDDNA